jgi:hypothetical protein
MAKSFKEVIKENDS